MTAWLLASLVACGEGKTLAVTTTKNQELRRVPIPTVTVTVTPSGSAPQIQGSVSTETITAAGLTITVSKEAIATPANNYPNQF